MSIDDTAPTWTSKRRHLAAVDLTLRAAQWLNSGGDVLAFKVANTCAAHILDEDCPEEDYRDGLAWCGVSRTAINAAVKVILVTGGNLPIYPIVHPLDRGHLLNLASSAGSAVVDCGKALARAHGNPKTTFPQIARALADYDRAHAGKVAANAALDAVGRYGSIETLHSDPWQVSP